MLPPSFKCSINMTICNEDNQQEEREKYQLQTSLYLQNSNKLNNSKNREITSFLTDWGLIKRNNIEDSYKRTRPICLLNFNCPILLRKCSYYKTYCYHKEPPTENINLVLKAILYSLKQTVLPSKIQGKFFSRYIFQYECCLTYHYSSNFS